MDELNFIFKERERLEQLYLGNFKGDGSLFGVPLNWSALDDRRCPLCNNRLRQKNTVLFCGGKRHINKQNFAITEAKFKLLTESVDNSMVKGS